MTFKIDVPPSDVAAEISSLFNSYIVWNSIYSRLIDNPDNFAVEGSAKRRADVRSWRDEVALKLYDDYGITLVGLTDKDPEALRRELAERD